MRPRILDILIAIATVAAPLAAQQTEAPGNPATPSAPGAPAESAAPAAVTPPPVEAQAPHLRAAPAARRRPPSDELLFIWAQSLAGSDSAEAASAARSLASVGGRALRHVRPLLQSPDTVVQRRAREVVAAIGTAGVEAPKTEAPKTEAPRTKAKAPKVKVPKTKAPKANARKAEAEKATAPKAGAPSGGAPEGEMRPSDDGARLAAALTAATSDGQRDSILVRLEAMGARAAGAVPAIVPLLREYPPDVRGEPLRRRMLAVLRAAGPAAAPAVPALAAALRRNDTLTTSAAGEAAENWHLTFDVFAAIGPAARPAMPYMVAALDQNAAWSPVNRDSAYHEATAARALAAMGPDGVRALLAALRTGNGVRRRNAAYGLSYVHTPEAVAALADVVRDTTHLAALAGGHAGAGADTRWEQAWQLEAARVAAIDALGAMGPAAADATPALAAVAARPAPSLGTGGGVTAASAAADAMRKIRGGEGVVGR